MRLNNLNNLDDIVLKIRNIAKKLFLLPAPLILLIIPLAFVLCVSALVIPENSCPLFQYPAYLISAYAFTVLIIGFKNILDYIREKAFSSRLYKRAENNRITRRFLLDPEFRTAFSLYQGLAVNTAFAIFKGIMGIMYQSFWFGAISIYYFILGFIKLTLIHGRNKAKKYIDKNGAVIEYKSCKLCGFLMLILNIGMAGMAVQMVRDNRYYEYPGLMIYISAAYAFYILTLSIVNLVKSGQLKSPIFSASKALNFTGALMSIYALQTALMARFGGEDAVFRQLINSITGGAICVIIFGIAVFMIIRSQVRLNNLKGEVL